MKAAFIWMYYLSESVIVTCQILLLQFLMVTNAKTGKTRLVQIEATNRGPLDFKYQILISFLFGLKGTIFQLFHQPFLLT